MTHGPLRHFAAGDLDFDLPARELCIAGREVPLQPQVFALLAHLVEHRDRVVPKDELLEVISPDAFVADGSLQRAISLARRALGPHRDLIRTFPRQGYRFVAPAGASETRSAQSAAVEASALDGPLGPPHYVRSGDVHVAYRTFDGSAGEADAPDVVMVMGWALPMDSLLELPLLRDQFHAVLRRHRLVLFDKRGTGQSDRVKSLPTLEQRMDDLRAVLDDVGSERVVPVGVSKGGPLCLAFAAAHPDAVEGLVLVSSFARMRIGVGYPWGWTHEHVERLRGYVRRAWGAGGTISAGMPSRHDDEAFRAWAARAERAGASPGAALELLEMNLSVDIRDLLPRIRLPTVVVHGADDPVIAVGNGRFLAEHLPNARYGEVGSPDHALLFSAPDDLARWIGWLGRR